MTRTPIKGQGRFGPAQSRARVFSTFVQPRVDNNTGEIFAKLGNALGTAADFQGQHEINQANEERQQGLADFTAGRIRDGKMIRDGELLPIESTYYMSGVEMGRGRRYGRDVRVAFENWKADNPRPDFDAGTTEDGKNPYENWMSEGLAQSQEEAGIDPDLMTDLEMSEYVEVINQVRQRDTEEQVSHINSGVLQDAQENFSSDIMGLSSEYEGDAEGFYKELANRLRVAVDVDGVINRNAGREMILESVINRARSTGDVSILENMPDVPFMTPELKAQRDRAVVVINSNIETSRTRKASEYLTINDDLVASGRFEGAVSQVDELFNQGLITDNQRRSQRRYIRNQQEQAANKEQSVSKALLRQSQESMVVQGGVQAMLGGRFRQTDGLYTDSNGSLTGVGRYNEQVWRGVERRVSQEFPDDIIGSTHRMAEIARHNQTPWPQLEAVVTGIRNQFTIETMADITPDDPSLIQLQQIMGLEEAALDLHGTNQDVEFISQVRAVYNTVDMGEDSQRGGLHQAVSLVARARSRNEPVDLNFAKELDSVLDGFSTGFLGFGTSANETANATQVKQDLQTTLRILTQAGVPERQRLERMQEIRDNNYVIANGSMVRRMRGRTSQESAFLYKTAIEGYAKRFGVESNDLSLHQTQDGLFVITDRQGLPLDISSLPDGAGRASLMTPSDIEGYLQSKLDNNTDFEEGLTQLSSEIERIKLREKAGRQHKIDEIVAPERELERDQRRQRRKRKGGFN